VSRLSPFAVWLLTLEIIPEPSNSMYSNQRPFFRVAALFAVSVLFIIAAGAADKDAEQAKAVAEVQGQWIRHQSTPQGVITFVKEHQGNSTRMQATDAAGKVLYAHASEFTIAQSGKVRIFTFFNRTVTAGPDQGQTAKEPVSFVFRVHNDQFVEAYGVLDDDPNPPRMLVWERKK
jgi:hypothetical protein